MRRLLLLLLLGVLPAVAAPLPPDLPPAAGADQNASVVVSREGGRWKLEYRGASKWLPGDTSWDEAKKAAGEFGAEVLRGVPTPMPQYRPFGAFQPFGLLNQFCSGGT